jgi:hypothetical protein
VTTADALGPGGRQYLADRSDFTRSDFADWGCETQVSGVVVMRW